MPVRTITHTSEKDGLTVVMRERTGGDALDFPTLVLALREYLKKQTGLDDTLTPRLWMRVMFVVNVIQQTTRLSGKNRFDIPSAYAPDDDITDFYEFLMGRSEDVIKFFEAALKLVNKAEPAPNPIGSGSETPSANASEPALSLATVN